MAAAAAGRVIHAIAHHADLRLAAELRDDVCCLSCGKQIGSDILNADLVRDVPSAVDGLSPSALTV